MATLEKDDYWATQIENIFHPQFDGRDRHVMLMDLVRFIREDS